MCLDNRQISNQLKRQISSC